LKYLFFDIRDWIFAASVAEEISREYLKYHRTGIETPRLQELGKDLRNSHSKKAIFTESMADLSSTDQYFVCTLCRSTINVFARTWTQWELTGPERDAEAKKYLLGLCDYFDVMTPEVCSGIQIKYFHNKKKKVYSINLYRLAK